MQAAPSIGRWLSPLTGNAEHTIHSSAPRKASVPPLLAGIWKQKSPRSWPACVCRAVRTGRAGRQPRATLVKTSHHLLPECSCGSYTWPEPLGADFPRASELPVGPQLCRCWWEGPKSSRPRDGNVQKSRGPSRVTADLPPPVVASQRQRRSVPGLGENGPGVTHAKNGGDLAHARPSCGPAGGKAKFLITQPQP